ncbi:MAG TPA: peptidase M23 [Syntrophomonas sp.]|jgi:murein DD-endopeptidase MepM/ murein hydrolase activator NlpD|nr:peptidase M23 [Syntrophomonas sp.]
MSAHKRSIAIMMGLVFIFSCILPVYADEIDEAREKLQQINQQIDAQQANVNAARSKQRSVVSQISALDQDIKSIEEKIKSLNDDIQQLEKEISQTQKDISQKEKELDKQVEILGERLVYVYEEGGQASYLEVLLASTDIKDFLTRYDMLKYVIEGDMELIDSINDKRRELDQKKSDLEVKQNRLVTAREGQQSQKALLDEQQKEKQTVLSEVNQEKAAYEQALSELEAASREVEALIRRSQSGDQLGTGIFTWPTPGYSSITSPYGMRYHPILKTRRMHTGMDIGAPMSAKIVAADSGTVIFSGWMGAYGQAIIVDHGQGLSTLYGHLSSLGVSNGQSVTKGQSIGKVGSTGWSTGPHLHFEVRINGQHTDPRKYV